ncbi:helix-turn-helix transcriptional regulator [Micromonospora sp. B11E3]|uniref:helix-turn-helix domain-containing protein n=1 Tax=Micromonospora sp. B11E3 TaxID=3153562 RepID=UPI00325DCE06
MTGYLLKLIRESIPMTQEQLAVDLAVDRATVQSWESGRRPFTAVPFGQAIATRQRLGRLGASTSLLAALDDAAEADLVLTAVLDDKVESTNVAEQPLGWSVLTHRLTDLILWAVLGQAPTFVRAVSTPHRRRGPVAFGPLLPADQQLGEIPYRQRDDSFMPAPLSDWRGSRLLRHLVQRLDASHPFVDLNIHNVWALLAARRGLALDEPDTGRTLLGRCTALLDSGGVSAQSRHELTSIVYSLRTDGLTGTGTGK